MYLKSPRVRFSAGGSGLCDRNAPPSAPRTQDSGQLPGKVRTCLPYGQSGVVSFLRTLSTPTEVIADRVSSGSLCDNIFPLRLHGPGISRACRKGRFWVSGCIMSRLWWKRNYTPDQVALCLNSSFFGFFAHSGFLHSLTMSGFTPGHISGASAGALYIMYAGW